MTLNTVGSAEKEKVSSEMKDIRFWNDVAPFAGRVVAYRGNSRDLEIRELVFEDASIGFGYIHPTVTTNWKGTKGDEEGYWLDKLIKQGMVSCTCGLSNSFLGSSFSMRLASRNEISRIAQAIITNQAKFECSSDKESTDKILKHHLSLLDKSETEAKCTAAAHVHSSTASNSAAAK